MTKLTKRAVEALKPMERDVVVWDDELPGFGVRVKASGVKSYIFQYRNSDSRSKRATIGRHGAMTADQARKQALQLKARVAIGTDPVTEKTIARKAPKVNELLDRYLNEHVRLHNKPKTQADVTLLINNHIRPAIGNLKVAGVTRNDIVKLHRNMSGTPRQANLVLSIISKAFNLAEVWNWRADATNPTRLVKRYPENKRERFLSNDELKVLGTTLRKAELEQTEQSNIIATIRLLALTGCRLSEILTLKWAYIDFQSGTLNLPDAKAGARSQPLAAPALEILAALPRIDGVAWALPNKMGAGPIDKSNMERAWRRIRKKAGLEDVRLHDLRHTVGTIAGASGANAFMVRDLLGHKTLTMTGRYVSRDEDPQKTLVNQVANHIDAAMSGKQPGKVVASPRRLRFLRPSCASLEGWAG